MTSTLTSESTLTTKGASEQESAVPPVPQVGRRPKASTNIAWNWCGITVEAIAGFIVTPLLIRGLGDETYGLWILIGSLTGCFGVLDMGLRGAVGRYVAFYHAKGDEDNVFRVLSTAVVTLCALACFSLFAVSLGALVFPLIYSIPANQIKEVQYAMLIVGVQLALFFIFKLSDALLWGLQRFDLLNAVDIPTTVIRTGLIAWLITGGYGGLITLAWISLATVLANGLVKTGISYLVLPRLRISLRDATRETFKDLIGFGFWNMVISLSTIAISRFTPLLVGGFLGVAAVAPLSVVMRLPSLASQILTSATGVLTPVSVALHAHNDTTGRRKLLLKGTRNSFFLTLYFFLLFVWLGKSLLSIWIRPDFAAYYPMLVILSGGSALPMTMSVARGMVTAMAKHKLLAYLIFAESATALIGGALLASFLGLIGFIISIAISATVFRGFCVLWLISRLTSIPTWQFVRESFALPLMYAALGSIPFYYAVTASPPTGWGSLIGLTLSFSVLYWGILGIGACASERVLAHFRQAQ